MKDRIVAELNPPPPTNAMVGDGSWLSVIRGEMDHTHCAVWERGEDGQNVFVGTRLCMENGMAPCSEFGSMRRGTLRLAGQRLAGSLLVQSDTLAAVSFVVLYLVDTIATRFLVCGD